MRDAFALLTIIPTGRYRAPGKLAVVVFPLVGLAIGGLGYLVAKGATPVWGALVASVLVVGVQALVTGAMHLDAVADLGDALGSRRSGAEGLATARDSRIGAIGAVSLVVSLLLLVALVGRAIMSGNYSAIVAAAIVGRTAMLAAVGLSTEPDSSAARLARGAGWLSLVAGLILGLALATLIALIGGVIAVAGGASVATLIAGGCRKRFGSVTGDVVGAAGVAAEITALLVLLAV